MARKAKEHWQGMYTRAFRREDTPALTRLLHRAYAELAREGLNFTAADQDDVTTLARATAGACWVCLADGEIVATVAFCYPLDSYLRELVTTGTVHETAWLGQLAVDPRYRHQGLASRLWRTGYEWFGSRGVKQIGLDTAEPARHLLELYRHWGFREVGTTHFPGKTYRSVILMRSLCS